MVEDRVKVVAGVAFGGEVAQFVELLFDGVHSLGGGTERRWCGFFKPGGVWFSAGDGGYGCRERGGVGVGGRVALGVQLRLEG